MSKRGGGFFLRLCASEFSEFFEGAGDAANLLI